MDKLRKNKKYLHGILLVSTVAMGITLLLLRGSYGENLTATRLGFILIPWVICAASVLPLIYLSWFDKQHTGTLATVQKVFFWLIAICFIGVFIVIYAKFVFGQ